MLSVMRLPLFVPEIDDLRGLLVGPAHLVRGPAGARLSVVLPQNVNFPQTRAEVLLSAFAERGLTGEITHAVAGQIVVRTEFTPALTGLAAAWTKGAVKSLPTEFRLDGQCLRWWATLSGRWESDAYQLGVATADRRLWPQIGLALKAVGYPAQLMGPRAGGPAWRISGRRRLAALRELIGEPPQTETGDFFDWPPR